jgi:hypothetical protein
MCAMAAVSGPIHSFEDFQCCKKAREVRLLINSNAAAPLPRAETLNCRTKSVQDQNPVHIQDVWETKMVSWQSRLTI